MSSAVEQFCLVPPVAPLPHTQIVTKLFHIVEPDIAVFGRKDYQQFRVITRMVRPRLLLLRGGLLLKYPHDMLPHELLCGVPVAHRCCGSARMQCMAGPQAALSTHVLVRLGTIAPHAPQGA